ncbi:MAG: PucR family transcriptional regulator [Solirubrobacterales bacterium]|nr:PucR family transcriptional regulator [Solirubrobacterales bacterium]
MATTIGWDRPTPRVAELIRTAAELLLAAPDDVVDAVDHATLDNADPTLLADPALVEAIRRANRANLLAWAEANVRAPGERVPANPGPEALAIARDVVRRGLDYSTLDAYRTGQNTAWRQWMALAFTLTADPAELGELLDVTARSIFTFVDETLAITAEHIERERERLTRGTHAERLEVVTLILEGAPISADRAATRLGYALDRHHTAAIVFSDAPEADQVALEQVAEALARAAGARRPFTVVASAGSLWTWVAGDAGPDLALVQAELAALPAVRVALGPTAEGMDGFRRSHLDALATQRLLHRTTTDVQLASYDDVQVVALATQDEERVHEFVERTLGPLARADAELRETLRTYLREAHNASRTAKVLFTHRNTILNRLARAEQLLPAPLDGRSLQVGLALEVVHWFGAR